VVVVVGAWGTSSEVFLRPLYAVKGSPATFATLEKKMDYSGHLHLLRLFPSQPP
jgi:hypothetical protein